MTEFEAFEAYDAGTITFEEYVRVVIMQPIFDEENEILARAARRGWMD